MPVEDGVIVFGSGEADLAENLPEDLIPASSALLESVERFLEAKDVLVATDSNITRGWLHVYDFIFIKFTVEISRFYVDLVNLPIVPGGER